MLTLCFFKVILNKFFLQKTVVYSKFTSCSGCKFLGFFIPKYFHVLHLSSALSATCSRKKSGKGFLSKFGGFSALRPAIRANAHLNAALEMLRENRTFSARKCARRCSSGGRGLSVQLIQIRRREICRRRRSAGTGRARRGSRSASSSAGTSCPSPRSRRRSGRGSSRPGR